MYAFVAQCSKCCLFVRLLTCCSQTFNQVTKLRQQAQTPAGSNLITRYYPTSKSSLYPTNPFEPQDIVRIEDQYMDKQPWWGLFHKRVVYLDLYRIVQYEFAVSLARAYLLDF
jgi:hypothetical protein